MKSRKMSTQERLAVTDWEIDEEEDKMRQLMPDLITKTGERLRLADRLNPIGVSDEKARELVRQVSADYLDQMTGFDELNLINEVTRGIVRDKADDQLYFWSFETKDSRIIQARIETNPILIVYNLEKFRRR